MIKEIMNNQNVNHFSNYKITALLCECVEVIVWDPDLRMSITVARTLHVTPPGINSQVTLL